jgi:hypothetical protein
MSSSCASNPLRLAPGCHCFELMKGTLSGSS